MSIDDLNNLIIKFKIYYVNFDLKFEIWDFEDFDKSKKYFKN